MAAALLRLNEVDRGTIERVRKRGNAPNKQHRTEWAMQQGDAVIDLISAIFGVDGRDLRTPDRVGLQVGRVRQVAMYIAHVTMQLTLTEVGMVFSHDRTTATHACHRIEDLRDEPEFDALIDCVERTVAYTLRADRGNLYD